MPIVAPNNPSVVEVLGTTIDNDVAGLPATCFSSQPQGPTEWISYTATCTGTLSISTCHPNTDYDTVLYVMLDSPAGGNCWDSVLGCNDDSAAPGCQINGLNRRSRVDVHVNSGAVVKIAVSGFNGASGTYAAVGRLIDLQPRAPRAVGRGLARVGARRARGARRGGGMGDRAGREVDEELGATLRCGVGVGGVPGQFNAKLSVGGDPRAAKVPGLQEFARERNLTRVSIADDPQVTKHDAARRV
jgi:hypothetical protein